MRLGYCLLLALSVDWTLGARILAVFPMYARSHHNMIHGMLRTLAERGHQVVNYSPFPLDKPVANYTDVVLEGLNEMEERFTLDVLTHVMNVSPVRAIQFLWTVKPHVGQTTFESESIKSLFKSDDVYDLIILEPFFAQEVLLSLGYKFNAPVIAIQPFGAFSLVNKGMGNALSLSFIPDYSFPYSDHMSLYERFLSAYSILSSLWVYYYQYLPSQEEFLKTYFKDKNMPPLEDMINNISLTFNNAHPNIHYAQPYSPNIIPIGGIHLSHSKKKDLPTEMKVFLDEAKHGVIYFALGSFLPDRHLPQTFFDNFIRVFRRLPQRVLWKTGAELADLPGNILTAKWVPQQDVLSHPNVQLFMTHGGLFSQHEAINAGVPVVCIPFFGDQPLNAKFYEAREIGVRLLFNTLSEETIYSALSTVLNDPKYKQNMRRLSRVYKDQPRTPADSMVFWVEYVLRHRGAPHLRPAASRLSWYQLALLDVLAVLLVTVTAATVSVWSVIRVVTQRLRSTKDVQKKKN